MPKYAEGKKQYRSTTFTPSKRRLRIKQSSYHDQVVSQVKEKFSYMIIGVGVLLGVVTGISYAVLHESNSSQPIAVNIVVTAAPTQAPTATSVPLPTVTTASDSAKPTEKVQPPVIDKTKAAQAAAAKPGGGAAKYVVKKEDTLWRIAERAYKSGYNFKDVVAYNKISNPNTIVAGQVLVLPPVKPGLPTDPTVLAQGGVGGPEVQGDIAPDGAMTTSVTSTSPSYTVVKGDTLWSIAERSFGDGFSWKEIAKANNVSDPTKLEPGTVLVIPR
jgi:nucleoid-associated protein YgaU